MKSHHGCPVSGTINCVSGKWKVLAIWHLGFGPKRFAQLRDLLAGVSEKVLTAQLRQLENDGIIRRAGEELIEPMSALCAWGTRYLGIPPSLPRYPKT
jgi:DNA-binding HxlR family transcriptional regulator